MPLCSFDLFWSPFNSFLSVKCAILSFPLHEYSIDAILKKLRTFQDFRWLKLYPRMFLAFSFSQAFESWQWCLSSYFTASARVWMVTIWYIWRWSLDLRYWQILVVCTRRKKCWYMDVYLKKKLPPIVDAQLSVMGSSEQTYILF